MSVATVQTKKAFEPTVAFALTCSATDKDFLTDCRRVLKGSGFRLWLRGRGPRSVHAGKAAKGFNGCVYTYSQAMLNQTLPVRFATKFGVYVRESSDFKWESGLDWKDFQRARDVRIARAVGMVLAVAKIWRIHGREVRLADLSTRGAK